MAKRKQQVQTKEESSNTQQTLFGAVKLQSEQVEVERTFNVFDFINDINQNKQYIFADDTTSFYEPFTVNRAMTIFPDTFQHGDFLNSNYHLDKRLQHDYLFYSVQKRKRWKQGGWLKKSEAERKELKILKDVAKHIQYNMKRTRQFWSMLTEDQQKHFLATYIYPDAKNIK
jgi:hypothetical protein